MAKDVANCLPLVRSFYTQLSRGGYPLFSNGEHWADIKQVIFLDPHFRKNGQIGEAANKVLKMCHRGREIVIDLPSDILHAFEEFGQEKVINARRYHKNRFFREVLFPNLHILPENLRDVLILHALDDKSEEFHDLLRLHPCVPSSPTGNVLNTPAPSCIPTEKQPHYFPLKMVDFPMGLRNRMFTHKGWPS